MQKNLTVKDWLKLDGDIRNKLIMTFAIPKSEGVQVMNGELMCDGVTAKDLEKLSMGAMIHFLGDDLPWYDPDLCNILLTMTVNKFYGKEIGEGLGDSKVLGAGVSDSGNGNAGKVGGDISFSGTAITSTEEAKPRRGSRSRKEAGHVPEVAQPL